MIHQQSQLFDPNSVSMRQFEPVRDLAKTTRSMALGEGQEMKDVSQTWVPGHVGHARYLAHRDALKRTLSEGVSPRLQASYKALQQAVSQQYDRLTGPADRGGNGVSVEVTPADPYGSPQEMASDVTQNRRLRVLSTESTGEHGFWGNSQNDQFRAVHDAYGHLATGRGFSRHGEEAAFRAHRAALPEEAHLALASETRGQNSYLNFGGGDFPPNVPVELPDWMTTDKGVPPPPPRPRGDGSTHLPLRAAARHPYPAV